MTERSTLLGTIEFDKPKIPDTHLLKIDETIDKFAELLSELVYEKSLDALCKESSEETGEGLYNHGVESGLAMVHFKTLIKEKRFKELEKHTAQAFTRIAEWFDPDKLPQLVTKLKADTHPPFSLIAGLQRILTFVKLLQDLREDEFSRV
jgi:hypothetical protein